VFSLIMRFNSKARLY